MGDRRGISGVEEVLHTSVATLYSNLVTRPTGRAVRLAIEQQIQKTDGPCLSILDFSQVGVIDFSCADEVIAKLLRKYREPDRPTDAFFIIEGASAHLRDQIQGVLERYKLLLVAVESDRPALWGPAPSRLRGAWDRLSQLGRALPHEFASAHGLSHLTASAWLKRLVSWGVAVPEGHGCFCSLPAVLDSRPARRGD